jgi:CelD/BcsL family acetyltransferase involved in cellulose biosynthesis
VDQLGYVSAPSGAFHAGELHLEIVGGLDALREEWRSLAAASGNIFSTWEWASTWWRHRGRGRPALVTACRDGDGRLVAIFPLYLARRRPVGVLRFIGHGPADELGPVCAPADRRRIAAALAAGLASAWWPGDLLLADHVPSDLIPLDGGRPHGLTVLSRQSSPFIDIAGKTFEECLSAWSAKSRQSMRRRERKLIRERGLSYRLSMPDDVGRDMETLFELHRARWGPRTSFLRDADFHREFARVAAREGWLRLAFLSLDGRDCAGLYGLRFGRSESFLQGGRLPEFNRESAGTVLLAKAIRAACECGLDEYRLLRGDEPYKRRFMTGDRPVVNFIAPMTPAGRVAVALGAAAVVQRRRAGHTWRGIAARARRLWRRGEASR